MQTQFFRFGFYVIIVCLTAGILNPVLAATSNLNVGEPRTVRMIYFLPNDRPYRAETVQKMKDGILKVQTFYAEQMEAHGFGKMTFRVETDSHGEPLVHRVDGRHPESFYTPWPHEIEEAFDFSANVYFILFDMLRAGLPRGGNTAKNGGYAWSGPGPGWEAMAHELGHAFGLQLGSGQASNSSRRVSIRRVQGASRFNSSSMIQMDFTRGDPIRYNKKTKWYRRIFGSHCVS